MCSSDLVTSVIGASYTSISFVTRSTTSARTRNLLTVAFIVVCTALYLALRQAPQTLLVFAGVMAGIMIAVGIGDLVGFEQLDLAEAGTLSYPPLLLLGLVMAAGMADAVVEQSRWPQILACGLVSGAGFGAYLAAQQVGVSDRLVPAVAAAAVGFLGRLVAQRLAAPALVIVLPSMLFLLPGLTMETGATLLGVEGLFNAAVIVVAIAAGVAFGNTLAKPITDRMGTLLPTELVMHQRG